MKNKNKYLNAYVGTALVGGLLVSGGIMASSYRFFRKMMDVNYDRDDLYTINNVPYDYSWIKDYQNEDVYINSFDNLKLHGLKIYAKQKTSNWVILVHGYKSLNMMMIDRALEFIKKGFNVLLIDQRYFKTKLNALFPKQVNRDKAEHVLISISKGIRTYISITTIISLITGFLTYLICEMFSLQGAVLWGFIAFVLNFIPTIGSIIAVLIPTIFALIQFPEISDVLFLSLALVAIQFVIGNIIYPRLMGNKLNISQFIVILSLVVWGAMWGTIGMFLSVPLMMILLIILSQFNSTKSLAILISGDGSILSSSKSAK